VVECVAKLVSSMSFVVALKTGHDFEVYFWARELSCRVGQLRSAPTNEDLFGTRFSGHFVACDPFLAGVIYSALTGLTDRKVL
jgi:hypothetical protein